jgi:hypothetical protein
VKTYKAAASNAAATFYIKRKSPAAITKVTQQGLVLELFEIQVQGTKIVRGWTEFRPASNLSWLHISSQINGQICHFPRGG